MKFLNQPITSLQVNTNFEDSKWGLAPPEWQNWVGSVLIVRRDRKEVTPREVQMLAEYSQFAIGPDITAVPEHQLDVRQRPSSCEQRSTHNQLL